MAIPFLKNWLYWSRLWLRRKGTEARDMKIRHPQLVKALGFAIAWLMRLWVSTLRYRYRPLGPAVVPAPPVREGRYIYAFWHESLLVPAFQFGRGDMSVLVSGHADGRIMAEAVRHLRLRVVDGSTTRGGVEAVRELVRRAENDHLIITPDGPRGPRRCVQPGVIYLAARTGLPIMPVAFGFHKAWRMNSWDCFALPCPGSAVVCVSGVPIHVPARITRDNLEKVRLEVEQAMLQVTEYAERWAEREGW
jgi:lysophospholipid acyltransferase (LPLAT)-like uncharacterized protein